MDPFCFQAASIEGLYLIAPLFSKDARGYFSKTFAADLFASHGIFLDPLEELESSSSQYTLRGLHFQHRNSQEIGRAHV